jgi:hypothetical protein
MIIIYGVLLFFFLGFMIFGWKQGEIGTSVNTVMLLNRSLCMNSVSSKSTHSRITLVSIVLEVPFMTSVFKECENS